MTIGIIGLGLIGASYAKRLSKTFDVYGFDIDETVMKKMQERLKGNALKHLNRLDIVVLALNPKQTTEFIRAHGHELRKNVLVTDVCGVKSSVVSFIEKTLCTTQSYLSHHPMSGHPEGGFINSTPTLFEGANLVYITTEKTAEDSLSRLHSVLVHLGFGSFSMMNASAHDIYIAHTSQLTHLISSALVLSNTDALPKEVMGNSYRDLTRIADIEPAMWSELFIDNKDALIDTLVAFEQTLAHYRALLKNSDLQSVKALLETTRKRYRQNR
jgi:prephenate dehydrogenase